MYMYEWPTDPYNDIVPAFPESPEFMLDLIFRISLFMLFVGWYAKRRSSYDSLG